MTTQLAFAFGMLVAVSIAMVIGIVVSLVKVIKLETKQKEATRDIFESIERVWQHISQVETNLNRRIDETERNIADETNEIRRNMDSRFDKFENKFKPKPEPDMAAIDLVIEKTTKKQLLKD
jgi:uncharacterized protein YlxW (UPF0749 family)